MKVIVIGAGIVGISTARTGSTTTARSRVSRHGDEDCPAGAGRTLAERIGGKRTALGFNFYGAGGAGGAG